MVTEWNAVALETVKTNFVSPPKAGRDLAIVHLAMYDAFSAVVPMFDPFYVTTNAPPGTSVDALLASAACTSLKLLYPFSAPALDEALSNTTVGIPESLAKTNGLQLGDAVAQAIFVLRSNDGWNAVVNYVPGTNAGEWRPTLPNFAPALDPQWGLVEPFGITNVPAYRPPPPPAITSHEYFVHWDYVRSVGQDVSSTRTPDQTEMAFFWRDLVGETAAPAGKWNLIARALSATQNFTLAENVRLFAMLNVAEADAGIVSWDHKFLFNGWRPIAAIREADTDGNPETYAITNWVPAWHTPNFPEYTSGHSCFSGAGAELLGRCFGSDNIPFAIADGFNVMPGVERTFTSIWQAAYEAGMSRIYGGVHFGFGNCCGLVAGSNVAVYCAENHFALIPEPAAALVSVFTLLILTQRRKAR
jgi:hypothetical protein